MHPILGLKRGLLLYSLLWLSAAALVAMTLTAAGGLSPKEGVVLTGLPSVVYALFSLGLWWIYGRAPLRGRRVPQLLAAHGVAAALGVGVWFYLGRAWGSSLGEGVRLEILSLAAGERWREIEPSWLASGLWLYLFAALVHYLFHFLDESRRAERKALDLRVQTREAELKALRAQVDPHFLFNCLNSVSALCVGDPAAARRMAVLLADFFRGSLRAGRRDAHPLAAELALASGYLEIERVRLGSRLSFEERVAPEALPCAVPPLLLQPLVENAVKHGIGHLLEGGTVRLTARRVEDVVEIEVENPCDPERVGSRGAKVGLANVRARLLTRYGPRAGLEITEEAERFHVHLRLPAEVEGKKSESAEGKQRSEEEP